MSGEVEELDVTAEALSAARRAEDEKYDALERAAQEHKHAPSRALPAPEREGP